MHALARALVARRLTSRSSGRDQRQRPASPGNSSGAPLNSRSVSLHSSDLSSSTFSSLFAVAGAASPLASSERSASLRAPGAAVGARTRNGARLSASVPSEAPLAGRRPRLRVAAPLGRRGVSLLSTVRMQANKSFEPRWTVENRPFVDVSKPAISGRGPRRVSFTP